MSKFHIISHGYVYEGNNSLFDYCGWPTVCCDNEGVLYAGYSGYRSRHIDPFGKAVFQKSFDGGQNWSNRIILADTPMDDRDVSLVALPDGRIFGGWLVNDGEWQTELVRKGILAKGEASLSETDKLILAQFAYNDVELTKEDKKGGAYGCMSDDHGMSWKNIVKLPAYNVHGPCVLNNGSLLLVGKTYGLQVASEGPITTHYSVDGISWENRGHILFPEDVPNRLQFEPHVVQMSDGRLLAMIRVEKGNTMEPGTDDFTMYSSVSSDLGMTWTMAKPTGLKGSPPHLLKAKNGMLILSYGRRVRPFGERIAISTDGENWEEHILFDGAESSDLGYTSTAEIPDGTFISVYYQRKAANVRPSVMYTKWKME